MISTTDFLLVTGLLICAFSLVAPETAANYSRERWLRVDVSRRKWKQQMFGDLVMKPWYPAFIRFYGLVGLVFLLIYLVFVRFSK
jgi:hypothetical protein